MQRYDEDYEREALISALSRNGNTGITGGMDPTFDGPPLAPSVDPQPPAPQRQTYAMQGYEASKLADAGHNTEKYQIGRVMQYHDPSKGITPELLADLNALGIGTFSGSGDRLSVTDPRNGNRLAAGTGDVIVNFTGEGPKHWTYLDTEAGNGPAQSRPQTSAQPAYNPYLAFPETASSFDRIQSLVPTDWDFYNTLQERLGQIVGGPKALDREALLRLLKA